MPHQCDLVHVRVLLFDQINHLVPISSGSEMFCLDHILFFEVEYFSQDLGRLHGPHIGTGQDQVKLRFQLPQPLCDLLHLLFALVGQRTLAVVFDSWRSRFHGDRVTDDV